jgi:hypothetical protein
VVVFVCFGNSFCCNPVWKFYHESFICYFLVSHRCTSSNLDE